MKLTSFFALFFVLITAASAGWFSAMQDPPVSLSLKVADSGVNVTNTSDQIIHEVTARTPDGETSVILADTIEPHKTVFFKVSTSDIWSMLFSEFKVTCKGYGSMKVNLPVQ